MVRPTELYVALHELKAHDEELRKMIAQMIKDCQDKGVNPYSAQLPDGTYVLVPLLAARSHLMAAQISLEITLYEEDKETPR